MKAGVGLSGSIGILRHRPDGIGATSQRLIPTSEQSGLLTLIVAMGTFHYACR